MVKLKNKTKGKAQTSRERGEPLKKLVNIDWQFYNYNREKYWKYNTKTIFIITKLSVHF